MYRYCRGVDRRDYELIRSCYHPDAIDNPASTWWARIHRGVESNLGRFERTMHFLGNILVEVDGDPAQRELRDRVPPPA